MKMKYGIDLGLTHSAICRMEHGEPVIIKTDTLKETMPSCVYITRRGAIKVGDSAVNDIKNEKSLRNESSNTYVEFKRTMGSDKIYHNSNLGKDLTSEELSAEVLKALKSFVSDEIFDSVVIAVPARFGINQKNATMEAAKLAGFIRCELIQEPIAASMAYGFSSTLDDGIWMVFNFDDSSFEVTLINLKNGVFQSFDADSDNYLGGFDIDDAIVEQIFIPYLQANFTIESILANKNKSKILRESLKYYASDVKMLFLHHDYEDIISDAGVFGVDDDGNEIELELTLTKAQVLEAMRPCLQKAINISNNLLERNNLSGSQLSKLILVGRPSRSPLIHQMLREQITPNVDTSIDPMTAVAKGAAIYASTIDTEVNEEVIKRDTIRLDVGYESTTVDTTEWVSVRPIDESVDSIMVELVRSDKTWSSGKTEINSMGNVIEAHLLEDKPNTFSVVAYDKKGNRLLCNPSEITITHGFKMTSALLPYTFAIGYRDERTGLKLLRSVLGLERNKPIPAVGIIKLRTASQLRAGNSYDTIDIPIYQVDESFDVLALNPAFLYEHVADIVITGKEINTFIPEGSNMEITLKVDRSEMMTVKVLFPSYNFTIEKGLDTCKKQSINEILELNERDLFIAQQKIKLLQINGCDTSFANSQMNKVINDILNRSCDPQRIHQDLKALLRELYKH